MWLNVWIQREVGASAVYSGFCLGGELVGRMFYLMSARLSACSPASGLSVCYFFVFPCIFMWMSPLLKKLWLSHVTSWYLAVNGSGWGCVKNQRSDGYKLSAADKLALFHDKGSDKLVVTSRKYCPRLNYRDKVRRLLAPCLLAVHYGREGLSPRVWPCIQGWPRGTWMWRRGITPCLIPVYQSLLPGHWARCGLPELGLCRFSSRSSSKDLCALGFTLPRKQTQSKRQRVVIVFRP